MNLSQNDTQQIPVNPFFHRGPIRDRSYFFGRTEETRLALQKLRNGQCVSIVGPRRIGKTSLLIHLCDPEVQKRYYVGEEYLFVYVDCQGLGGVDTPQFYQLMWDWTRKELAERGKAGGWAKSACDFNEFREALMTIRGEGYETVFLFDEFESIAVNRNLDQVLFSDLRSLVPTVIYTTASRDSLYDLTYTANSALSSPFFNVFSEIRLGFLKAHEAEDMVHGLLKMTEQGHVFTEKDLDFVFDAGGYHPFFLQMACDYLFEQKLGREELAAEDFESVRRHYAEEAQLHFRYIWDHLGASEQKVVRLACEGRVSQLGEEQKQNLQRRCILYENTVFSSVFAEFVQRQAAVGAARETLEANEKRKAQSQVALDALLIASSFGGLFTMVLAILSHYSLLFWLAGSLILTCIILLLMRFIQSQKSQGRSQ